MLGKLSLAYRHDFVVLLRSSKSLLQVAEWQCTLTRNILIITVFKQFRNLEYINHCNIEQTNSGLLLSLFATRFQTMFIWTFIIITDNIDKPIRTNYYDGKAVARCVVH